MTPQCQSVLDRLGAPLSGELLAHAQGCSECQQVQRSYELMRSQALPSAEVAPAGVSERVASELHRRPRAYRWWWGPVALGAIYSLLVVVGILVLSVDDTAPQSLRIAGLGLALASLIGFVAALAPGSRRTRNAVFPVVGVMLLSVLAAARTTQYGQHFWVDGASCLLVEVLTSLIPLALGVWLLTRTAFHPIRSLLLPFCAATAGLVVLSFHCADGLPAHLLVFHLLPWLVLSAVAWLIRARTPSYSYAP